MWTPLISQCSFLFVTIYASNKMLEINYELDITLAVNLYAG